MSIAHKGLLLGHEKNMHQFDQVGWVLISRRTFIGFSVLTTLVATGAGLTYRFRYMVLPVPALSEVESQITIAIIDRLLPRDPISPGAVDLGIDKEILGHIAQDKMYRRILREGFGWFDEQAHKIAQCKILELTSEQQDQLIAMAASSAYDSTANWVYRHLRNDAMRGYYSHPESWEFLCYPGPPQPAGFLDHAEAPSECRLS